MFQRKLKQKDLAKILGTTPSRISEILNGKRQLNFELAQGLYSKLNIDPRLIFSEKLGVIKELIYTIPSTKIRRLVLEKT